MKGALKYILLFVVACICSFIIYYYFGPKDNHIGIEITKDKKVTETFTVSFNTNGGSKISELKIKKDKKIPIPNSPEKEGYTFQGWYYQGELFDFNTKITKNIKLEAIWMREE